jgi:hypothetical protein
MHFAQAARGDAIIAEILRLSKNVPPVFRMATKADQVNWFSGRNFGLFSILFVFASSNQRIRFLDLILYFP